MRVFKVVEFKAQTCLVDGGGGGLNDHVAIVISDSHIAATRTDIRMRHASGVTKDRDKLAETRV